MSDSPLWLSVITVCRNAVATIGATAESVVCQTCKEFEWVVIDGGSTDGTFEVLARYQHCISHLVSAPDRGIYDAMNKGLRLARGRYVLYLNADDVFASCEVLRSAIPHLVIGRRMYWGAVVLWDPVVGHGRRVGGSFGFWDAVRCKLPHHQGIFLDREWALAAGGFDERYGLSADIHLIGLALRGGDLQASVLDIDVAHFQLGGASGGLEFTWLGLRDRVRALFAAFGPVVGVLHGLFLGYYVPKVVVLRLLRGTAVNRTWRKWRMRRQHLPPHA